MMSTLETLHSMSLGRSRGVLRMLARKAKAAHTDWCADLYKSPLSYLESRPWPPFLSSRIHRTRPNAQQRDCYINEPKNMLGKGPSLLKK